MWYCVLRVVCVCVYSPFAHKYVGRKSENHSFWTLMVFFLSTSCDVSSGLHISSTRVRSIHLHLLCVHNPHEYVFVRLHEHILLLYYKNMLDTRWSRKIHYRKRHCNFNLLFSHSRGVHYEFICCFYQCRFFKLNIYIFVHSSVVTELFNLERYRRY